MPADTEHDVVEQVLIEVGRRLRERSVVVGTGQLVRYRRAVASLNAADLRDLYWAGRACLVTRQQDLAAYDAVFAELFLGREPAVPTDAGPGPDHEARLEHRAGWEASTEMRERDVAENGEEPADEGTVGAVASAYEVLRHRSFADCTPEEAAELAQMLRRLRVSLPERWSRRNRPGVPARRLDLRRTVRQSLRTQGELLRRDWKRRGRRRRNLVLLLDISGSMASYSRALLQFGHAVAGSGAPVEVFCFGTRLTRVTACLHIRDPDIALTCATETVLDWDGGTRIGESIGELLRDWGGRSFLRGAVIVICSDGLERGDPELLGGQVARLSRLAHRLVWVNPLAGDEAYEPVTRGMQAALPYIDRLVAGDTLASLEQLADLMHRLDDPIRA